MTGSWVEARLVGTLNTSLQRGMKVGVKPLGNGRFIVASPQWNTQPMVINEMQGRQAVKTKRKNGQYVAFKDSGRCDANCRRYGIG